MDPILVDATLNCLAILIRTRPPISTKIISAILNFNPMKQGKFAHDSTTNGHCEINGENHKSFVEMGL